MDTILHFLPMTAAEQDAFRAAAPDARHIFLPTDDRNGVRDVPDEILSQVTVLLGSVRPRLLPKMGQLKWLQAWSAGVDHYLQSGLLREDVALTCAIGCYGPAVSEHLLAMLLALWKRLPNYHSLQHTHSWNDLGNVRSPIGTTVLVGGAGDIGSTFARLMKAMGAARVIGLCRNTQRQINGFDELHTLDDIDVLLPQADVVALALPHTAETAGLMDARRIGLMKPDAVLLNAGRGTAVDDAALAEALNRGQLWGAGMDVFAPEPLPAEHPLWSAPRCIITPHVAGIFNHMEPTTTAIRALFLENLRHYTAGEPLRNRVH